MEIAGAARNYGDELGLAALGISLGAALVLGEELYRWMSFDWRARDIIWNLEQH